MKKKIQKPFDIQAAKNGAVVETEEGNSVRIICYDRLQSKYPIVALVNYKDKNGESCYTYTIGGQLYWDEPSENDLVLIEEVDYPKFNVGDWIISEKYKNPWLIITVTSDYYEAQDVRGYKEHLYHSLADNSYRPWTLDDARSGDVLVCEDGHPFIFKECIDGAHPGYPVAFCGINCGGEFTSIAGQTWWTNSSVRPATYDEKQQFFNKLEEIGYKWNIDTLTLSKVEKWRDNQNVNVNGYFIDNDSNIIKNSGWNIDINHNVFSTKKQAKAALAMARISQIMANDGRFGGVVTDDEWIKKPWATIIKIDNKLTISNRFGYTFLAFHTIEQANLFLEENEDLIKAYYMLD